MIGVPYAYRVAAHDPDGDPVTFRLVNPVAGMQIDAATGLFCWTPTSAQAGVQSVRIVAEDGRGGSASQTYDLTVTVLDINHAPVIDSPSQTITRLGQATAVIGTSKRAIAVCGAMPAWRFSRVELGSFELSSVAQFRTPICHVAVFSPF